MHTITYIYICTYIYIYIYIYSSLLIVATVLHRLSDPIGTKTCSGNQKVWMDNQTNIREIDKTAHIHLVVMLAIYKISVNH